MGIDLSWVRFEHVRWALLILLVLGLGLMLNAGLSTFGEGLALRARRWERRRRLGLLAELDARDAPQSPGRAVLKGAARLRRFWPIALGGVMALVAWDLPISTFFFVLGIGLSYVVEARRRLARLRRLTRQAEMLIVKFRSMYSVENSIFITLELAARELPLGEVRRAVEKCVALNNSGRPFDLSAGSAQASSRGSARGDRLSTDDSLAPLRALESPHLRRLAGVLARAESAAGETFNAVLVDLETDVARQLQVEREAGVEMAALKGTARALQGAALLAAIWAVLVPTWRAYFLATFQQRMLFIFLASIVALGSVYLEREIFAIEKGEFE